LCAYLSVSYAILYRHVMPNTHRRRRRASTVELSCVGVASASAVFIGLYSKHYGLYT